MLSALLSPDMALSCCAALQVEALARSVLRDPLHITVGERNSAQVRSSDDLSQGFCLLAPSGFRGLCVGTQGKSKHELTSHTHSQTLGVGLLG
jgi:hypothetical protein